MANKRRDSSVIKKETDKPKNKKKKTSNKKASSKSTKAKRGFFASFVGFVANEKVHAITGVFLLLFTLFLFFSFLSFCFSHEADDSIFNPNLWKTLNAEGEPKNNLGILGLYFSFLFFKQWFGIASFGLLILSFIYGFRLLVKKSLLPIIKTTFVVLAITILTSMFFAFILPEYDWLGGDIGYQLQKYFSSKLGKIGFTLLLLFFASVILISFGGMALLKRGSKEEGDSDSDSEMEEEDEILKNYLEAEMAPVPKEEKSSLFSRLFSSKNKDKKNEQPQQEEEKEEEEDQDWDEFYETQISKSKTSVEQKEEITPSEVRFAAQSIPGEDIFIDDEPELIDEPFGDEESEEEEEPIDSEEEAMDEDLFSEEGAESEYLKLEPYNPREDLPHYCFPEMDLLENYPNTMRTREQREQETAANKLRIKETLEHYNITIQSISAIEGPTITLYEIVPTPGIRISRIRGLEDDIALSLSALGIRIIAPMPGKGTIGIEVPNTVAQIVPMKSVIFSEKFQNTSNMALPIAIGKTISNEVFVFDLAKMPHVLMAGATGQGKSVGLNAILTSLLYKKHPAELKFILVDPKKVELTLYSKIERHYLAKLPDVEDAIITDTKKVVRTLTSLCQEMDVRYELLKTAQCRNIVEYNEKFKARRLNPLNGHRFLPYIVLIFDEFADCIMTAGREVETPIARLAQLARAIGIHLIIATQRPSVNVITGLIKANFPARIAFRVSSKIDSRTILDSGGAESLIGKGDMLVSTGSAITRVQCAMVDTPEISRVCDFIGEQHGYTHALMLPEVEDESSDALQEVDDGEFDPCFADAAREVVSKQQGSTSFLQRKFKLGYNRAGRIMDQLEREKIVGQSNGSKTRDVLIKDMNTLEEFLRNNGIS